RDGGRRRQELTMRARLIALLLMAVTSSACTAPYSIFDAASKQARWLAVLGGSVSALMVIITLVMGVLLLWGIRASRRGSLNEHLPVDIDGGKRWILFGGVVLPVIV